MQSLFESPACTPDGQRDPDLQHLDFRLTAFNSKKFFWQGQVRQNEPAQLPNCWTRPKIMLSALVDSAPLLR